MNRRMQGFANRFICISNGLRLIKIIRIGNSLINFSIKMHRHLRKYQKWTPTIKKITK